MFDHEHDHVPHLVPATPLHKVTRWESFSFGFCMGLLIAALFYHFTRV